MADSFDPTKYKDTHTDEVQKLIEAKAKGQKREAPAPKAAKGNVIDLVAALQESLGSVKKGKNALSHSACRDGQGWLKRPSVVSKGVCVADPPLSLSPPSSLTWCILRCSYVLTVKISYGDKSL
jgi:hypothetical protein